MKHFRLSLFAVKQALQTHMCPQTSKTILGFSHRQTTQSCSSKIFRPFAFSYSFEILPTAPSSTCS